MAQTAGSKRGAARTAPPPSATAPPRDPNALTDDQVRSARYLNLLSVCRRDDAKLQTLMDAVKAFRKERTVNRNTIQREGYPLALVDRVLEAERADRRDLQAEADLEAWMREQGGLPIARTGEQLTLELDQPDTVKDEVYWAAAGYAAGVRGDACELPAACSPIFHQTFTREWGKGQETLAWAMTNGGVNPERARTDTAASRPDIEDESTGDDDSLTEVNGAGIDDPGASFDEGDADEGGIEARQPAAVH